MAILLKLGNKDSTTNCLLIGIVLGVITGVIVGNGSYSAGILWVLFLFINSVFLYVISNKWKLVLLAIPNIIMTFAWQFGHYYYFKKHTLLTGFELERYYWSREFEYFIYRIAITIGVTIFVLLLMNYLVKSKTFNTPI